MRFPHLMLFVTRLLRVPTPLSPLNRASHSPAHVHPEALHLSETFSLSIQLKQLIWESHISCYLRTLLRVPIPSWVHFHSFSFMTLFGCKLYPVLSDIPSVFCCWSSSDCYTSGMCHQFLASLSLFRSSWSLFFSPPIGILVRFLREPWLPFYWWCFSSIV